MGFSGYLENKLLDHVLGQGSNPMPQPANVYIALFTSSATSAELEASNLTNEVAPGLYSYSRKTVTFSAAAGGESLNSVAVTWSNLPPVTIKYLAVMNGNTLGSNEVLFFGQLPSDKPIDAGDGFSVLIGDLKITLE